jgi:hypothetical protein
MTWMATNYAHVCFDEHPDIGRQIHFYKMEDLRWSAFIMMKGTRPEYGSRSDNRTTGTGAGYRFRPRYEGVPLDPKKFKGELSSRGVNAVAQWLNENHRKYRQATIDEQIVGIDIVTLDGSGDTFEVKARDRSFDFLFIQLSETNAEKQYL